MYNNKLIIINGMQRGGTNIVWNFLQSHPDIVSPIKETGEILYPIWMKGKIFGNFRKPVRSFLKTGWKPFMLYTDKALYEHKFSTLENESNKYKYENEIYDEHEIKNAILVTKSLAQDIFFTPALTNYFSQSHVISVVRNGLAVCEGLIRRGKDSRKAAFLWKKVMNEIVRQDQHLGSHLLLKFEDVLSGPINTIERVFNFVNVNLNQIDKVRIKSKKIITDDGVHSTTFAAEGSKIWINKSDLIKYIDPNINQRQIDRLSSNTKSQILKIIGPTMEMLGYTQESIE